MNSSPFMDKQIMGLLGSPASIGGGDLINLMSPQDERRENGSVQKKEENLPSYDFQPIRPAPTPPTSYADDAARHSRFSSGSHFEETTLGPDIKLAHHYGASVDDVESTMKKYADIILHALEGTSSRLSQLESRTCILENSVDDLKVSIGNNYGSTDGKLRQMENILREVQTGVRVLQDKQEIAEAHLELAKLQLSTKAGHHQSESSQAQTELQQQQPHLPLPQPPMQPVSQLSAVASSLPPFSAPNAPPPPQQAQLPAVAPSVPPTPPFPSPNIPPPPQQIQPSVPFTSQSPLQPQMPLIPSFPREQSYLMPPPQVQQYTAQSGQPNELTHQQQEYQVPQSQQVLPQSQYYQPSHQIPQYSQAIRAEDSKSSMPPTQPYPPNIRQLSPPSQHPTGPPSHQYYGANPPLYELPPASRPSSGSIPILSSYGGAGFSEPYPYSSSPSHYNMKQSPFSSAPPTAGGSGSHQRLPTAKILPQAVPAGSSSSGGGPSPGRVQIDDVVDKVSTMGFSRDQVRATVRKLTENGQSVDLNVVLDKLMNDRDTQQPAKGGWFGR